MAEGSERYNELHIHYLIFLLTQLLNIILKIKFGFGGEKS